MKLTTFAFAFALSVASLGATTVAVTGAERKASLSPLERQIRSELITLPFYGVFDYLEFDVQGSRVVLRGEVSRPTLQSTAVNVVRRLPGVTDVVDDIRVLPLSRFDDTIRLSLMRAIYGDNWLSRYGLGANPWIRLIVQNGNVTLEGYVDRKADADIAFLRANSVPGAFTVTNHLKVRL